MSTKRLWAIAGGAAVLVAIIVVIANLLTAGSGEAAPIESAPTPTTTATTPTPTATPTAAASSSPTPSATPTTTAPPVRTPTSAPTAPPPVTTTCEEVSTSVFRAMMSAKGWTSLQTQDEPVGARPFDVFSNGAPYGAIVCRWAADPRSASGDSLDFAWSRIDPENAVAGIQRLGEAGFTRVDAPEGVYLSSTAPGQATDAQGWGQTYLFTPRDVRWAPTRADVAHVKAPTDAG